MPRGSASGTRSLEERAGSARQAQDGTRRPRAHRAGPGRAGGKWPVPESPRHIECAALRPPRRAPSYRWRGSGAGPRIGSGRRQPGEGRGHPGEGRGFSGKGRGHSGAGRGLTGSGAGLPLRRCEAGPRRGRGRRVQFKPRSWPRLSPGGLGPQPARPSVTSGTRPRPAAPGQCRCPRKHREGSGSPAPFPL